MVKFVFSHSKLRKQPFLAEIFKIQGGKIPHCPFLPTPMLTGSNTNGNCEENPQQYYYIWNRVPKVMLLNKLQRFKGASFSTVNCTSATQQLSIFLFRLLTAFNFLCQGCQIGLFMANFEIFRNF